MTRFAVLVFSLIISLNCLPADTAPCGDYGECDDFRPSLNDNASLQKGLNTFINYCYGCHSIKYSRWGRISKDLEIPEDILFQNLVFNPNTKPGDLMKGSVIEVNAIEWFGVSPPDLSLVTRAHGSDWVYTYLRTFYEDSSKPYGVNNMVYPGAAMPNILGDLQGRQVLGCRNVPILASNGGIKRDDEGNDLTEEKCGYLKLISEGKLSKTEFDALVFDLTNFLTYIGEPSRRDRERMGWYVIFFFIIFTAVSYLLFREYQKDYH